MWRNNLSVPLRVDALVSHYLTNKLIRHRPLPNRPKPSVQKPFDFRTLSGITRGFPRLSQRMGHVTYALLTRSPLTTISITQKSGSFDLHALATPPAFVLSQDQTLQFLSFAALASRSGLLRCIRIGLNTHVCKRECRRSRPKPGSTPFRSSRSI